MLEAKLNISMSRSFRFLLFLILGIATSSFAAVIAQASLPDYPLRNVITAILSVDNERSIPTWYSAFGLLTCAILLSFVAYLAKQKNERFLRHWQLLSLIFIYLSLDEALSFHERLIRPVRGFLGTEGFLYFAWVIPAAVLLSVFLVGYLSFLAALPKRVRQLFLIAGSVFVGGALGMEMVGGKILSLQLPEAIYVLCVTCEEFLEMLGVIIFLYALLTYLRLKLSNINISFTD